MHTEPLALTAATAVSAMGRGSCAMLDALRSGRGGLRPNDFDPGGADCVTSSLGWIGRVDDIEHHALPAGLSDYECRNNRLADMALRTDGFAAAVAAAIRRHGADRIAVVLGTSTSGVLSSEDAYLARDAAGRLPPSFNYALTHDMVSVARYVRAALDLRGPAMVVSTACASAAKTFIEASHLIRAGLCDAAIIGGVDTLCRLTLRGFAALGLISPVPCRPCDAARSGISIGEAAGFALLEPGDGPLLLLGAGASSDGYHMSAPHPEGIGAIAAMRGALSAAGLPGDAVDYVSLHGTGTPANDAMEDAAVTAVFGPGMGLRLDQGMVGAHAGRVRRGGRGDGGDDDRARPAARLPRRRPTRPRLPRPGPDGHGIPAGPPRHGERVRLRRHQLQPAARRTRLTVGPVAVIRSVAVLGPGLLGWTASRPILAGTAPWQTGDVVLPAPTILSATERRRTGPVIRLALAVATEAAEASGLDPRSLRTVFGSGNGDALTVGAILEAISAPDGFVSPTQFHNSVHNAAAGYWSIGVGSTRPACCIACEDWTFAASLMKAVAECHVEGEPVLLCVYDTPMPPPLDAVRSLSCVFGVALVLAPDGAGPRLSVRWDGAPATGQQPLHPALLAVAAGNPAARSLRLLEALARGGRHEFDLDYLGGRLQVGVTP